MELDNEQSVVALELKDPHDGSVHRFGHGYSFGAPKSVAGELVFQTGMVGYPESITDPSYRGQILVLTFPLVGNYGVPSREERDALLKDLPAHFEAAEIHIAGLVVASYSGQDFSHHLATSSLGQWLKEQDVPAIYGVDTRDLTKRIREKGSMLGRLLAQKQGLSSPRRLTNGSAKVNGMANGNHKNGYTNLSFEEIPWRDPNGQNLVAEGETTLVLHGVESICSPLTCIQSLLSRHKYIHLILLLLLKPLWVELSEFYS